MSRTSAESVKPRRSLVADAQDVDRVRQLVELGARIQLLEAVSNLPRERLVRIYKEVRGESPPKGMLPFSSEWFMTWQPNIHGSLFLNLYQRLIKSAPLEEADAMIMAYRLYKEQVLLVGLDPVLTITRAWRLVQFVDGGILTMASCGCCAGQFVVHRYELLDHFCCGLCAPPSRAGQGREWQQVSEAPLEDGALMDGASAAQANRANEAEMFALSADGGR